MDKLMVTTDQAPAAIGPYSQAMRIGQLLFTSGQIPLDLAGNIVSGGIEAQTKQVFSNLSAILQAAGAQFEDVVKATVYVKNMDDFSLVNTIYATYFDEHKPARTTVEVARLPKDALIEIDLIVAIPVE